ncbi:phosphonate import ATP-binding protein PhnC [Enterobacter cloacae BWH 43]|nr:phosphonate import ATP-binding protein PhnC [Enterobacter cloacae BWH 43]
MQTVIRVEKLSKTFHHNKALHAVDLTVQQGEMVALLGPSGSGKSTLLRHLSGLITCDKTPESHVELLGNTVQRAGRLTSDIRKSRAQTGYIFQQFNLVNRLTVLDNVLIGALGSTPFWRTCLRFPLPEAGSLTGADPRRHGAFRPPARVHPVRRTTAARGDCARADAESENHSR